MNNLYSINKISVETLAVSLAEFGKHSRIDADVLTDEQDLLTSYLSAAQNHIEDITAHASTVATYEMKMGRFPYESVAYYHKFGSIKIPRFPLIAVSSVAYKDVNGDSQTHTDFQFDNSDTTPLLSPTRFTAWPITDYASLKPVTVTFTAGYTTVPHKYKQAIRLLAANFYENREATISGTIIAEIPYALKMLIYSLRNK